MPIRKVNETSLSLELPRVSSLLSLQSYRLCVKTGIKEISNPSPSLPDPSTRLFLQGWCSRWWIHCKPALSERAVKWQLSGDSSPAHKRYSNCSLLIKKANKRLKKPVNSSLLALILRKRRDQ